MSSHVVGRKMHLSKLLFIALVALYVVFAQVSAEEGEEIVVDAEGEGGPGAMAVEADEGESQAAADLVRSQMASSRAGSGSISPSKKGKPNKMKIAIIISLILLVLAITFGVTGYFVVRPKINAMRDEKMVERMKGGFGADFKFEKTKLGDEKKESTYVFGAPTVAAELEKTIASNREELEKSKCVKKMKDGNYWFSTKGKANQDAILKVFKHTLPGDAKDQEKEFAGMISTKLLGGDAIAKVSGTGWILMSRAKVEGDKKDDKKDKKDDKKKK